MGSPAPAARASSRLTARPQTLATGADEYPVGADGTFKDFYNKIAAVTGALLYVLMWTVVLPPENNPVLDDHLLGALTLVVLAMFHAGDTWGLGRWWSQKAIVEKYPAFR